MNQDLQNFIVENNGIVHDYTEEDYDFLDEGETCVLFENPNHSQDMLLVIGPDSLTLTFDVWSRTFMKDEQGIAELIEEARNILDVRSYIWKASINGQDIISLVRDDPGIFYDLCQKGFEVDINGSHLLVDPSSITQSFVFWDPMMMNPTRSCWLN